VQGGLASALALVGLVAYSAPAFGHNNLVNATGSCASPLGTGYVITWNIANDYNLTETGHITSVTGGLGTLSTTSFSLPASPGTPYASVNVTQTLPASASGTITLDTDATWSDGFTTTDSGTFNLASLNCAAPVQTIAGHIYLCNNSNPTTTEETGGTLSAPTTPPVSGPNPLGPTNVAAGTFTMTANAPPHYQFTDCGGFTGSGGTATQSVTVPSGGHGVGLFYVTLITQSISGDIYLCNAGSPTTTEKTGGTLSAPTTPPVSGPNPLAPTNVAAGTFTMTADAPTNYQFTDCGGFTGSGGTATESVTVPVGLTGHGIFYVTAITQTIAGDIFLCNAGSPSTTEVPGGTLGATGPQTIPVGPNPLALTEVPFGAYTMTAGAPAGYLLVACGGSSIPNGSGSSATEAVPVPLGGHGFGSFYVTPITQTIAGDIYLCNAGSPTSTEVPGGNLSAPTTPPVNGPNPLAPTNVAAGTFIMTATAPANYLLVSCKGSSIPNGSGSTATESVTVPVGLHGFGSFYVVKAAPSLSLKKTSQEATYSTVGQIITYDYLVTNTGNETLSNISVIDTHPGTSVVSCPDPTLAPAASETCSATYSVLQSDIDTGSITNVAKAYGTPPGSSTAIPSNPSTVTITAATAPAITLVKSAQQQSYSAPGQTINYNYLVTNTGNVTLHDVGITDGHLGLIGLACPDPTLAPAAFETCTATYSTTAADVTAGNIINMATAHGTPPGTSTPVVSPPSSVTIPLAAITVVKTANLASYSAVGQTITYSYLVTNTGNITLTSVGVNDAHLGLIGLTCPVATLAPAASETCTANYLTTLGDLSAGSIINTATSTGTPPGGPPVVSPPSSVTIPVSAISILKQVCGSVVASDCGVGGAGPWVSSAVIPSGNTAYWKITVTNTGQIALTGVSISDPLVPGCTGTSGSTPLAVGASASVYCSSPDITADFLNVATAVFTGQNGPPPSSQASVTVAPAIVTQGATTSPGTTTTPVTKPAVVTAPAVTG
jgi:uncharacterized repeat protein (TIGR01451 family)